MGADGRKIRKLVAPSGLCSIPGNGKERSERIGSRKRSHGGHFFCPCLHASPDCRHSAPLAVARIVAPCIGDADAQTVAMSIGRTPWRIVGLLCITATSSYICRVNVSASGVLLMSEFGLSQVAMGRVFTTFLPGYALSQVPAGALADRRGARLRNGTFCRSRTFKYVSTVGNTNERTGACYAGTSLAELLEGGMVAGHQRQRARPPQMARSGPGPQGSRERRLDCYRSSLRDARNDRESKTEVARILSQADGALRKRRSVVHESSRFALRHFTSPV